MSGKRPGYWTRNKAGIFLKKEGNTVKNSLMKSLIVLFAVTSLVALMACTANTDADSTVKIKGATVEKPVREIFDMAAMMAEMFGSGGPGGAMGAPGGGGETGAPGGEAAGGPGGMAAGATGGPPGMGSDESSIPAVYVDNGTYAPKKSKTAFVSAGETKNNFATGLKIQAEGGGEGGVYVTGIGSDFTLANSEISVSCDSTGAEGGMNTGAAATDYGTLTLRNVDITTDGKSRCATAATQYGTLKVYNSTLTAHGGAEDASQTAVGPGMGVGNFARTHCSMSNSYSYFYYTDIIANGWGALSTDGAEGFVYLEANHCNIKNTKSGYGTYADGSCHDFFNNCKFDVAETGIVIAGEADATLSETDADCGGNFVMIHCVMGSYKEVSTLEVTGGKIDCGEAGVLVKSQNALLNFDGVDLTSKGNLLVKSVVNDDTNATKTEGKKVYGIHASFKDMTVSGDIVHEDTDRTMWVYLDSTTLSGAIQDACLVLDSQSRWVATADSTVTLTGDVALSQIEAPTGVTITAVGGESGTFTLSGGGMLVLKTS
jgi:hypothetical protein